MVRLFGTGSISIKARYPAPPKSPKSAITLFGPYVTTDFVAETGRGEDEY